jgi:hypothetical protein
MGVLKIKSHKLYVLEEGESYKDEYGNWHEGSSTWSAPIPCEAVPSGKGEEKAFEDGTVSTYSFTLYLPKRCVTLAIGQKVRLERMGIEGEYVIKGFHPYQHQAKAWV